MEIHTKKHADRIAAAQYINYSTVCDFICICVHTEHMIMITYINYHSVHLHTLKQYQPTWHALTNEVPQDCCKMENTEVSKKKLKTLVGILASIKKRIGILNLSKGTL